MLRPEGLFEDYLKFSQLRAEALALKELDLSSIDFFHPTLLLPLGIFIKQNPEINVILPTAENVSNYFLIITESGKADKNKSYIPIIKLPQTRKESYEALRDLDIYRTECGGPNALYYFTDEFVDNIYQHSIFTTAWVMAQKYRYAGYLEFCILDNGITIPQSYQNREIPIENDKAALEHALKGISTKPEKGRGFGIRTSINVLTKGLHGACLIVSRMGGICANDLGGRTSFNIDEENLYNGTLISVKMPIQESEVDISAYLE